MSKSKPLYHKSPEKEHKEYNFEDLNTIEKAHINSIISSVKNLRSVCGWKPSKIQNVIQSLIIDLYL